MASSTGHPGVVSRETYWKRRAFVLAGALLVLAIIAYACRPGGEESGEPSRSEAGLGEQASPSVAPTEPSDDESADAGDEETEDEDAEPGEDAEGDGEPAGAAGGGTGGGGGSGEGGGEVPAPERAEDPCRPQDVVVTFDFAEENQEIYGAGVDPGFRITVVNTGEQTCTVDVGGEAMEVRIHSGDDRIFSTADCVKGEGAQEQRLNRGVPYEYTVVWERERSFTDCREGSITAKAGWYRANLHGDYAGDQSQLTFQLKA